MHYDRKIKVNILVGRGATISNKNIKLSPNENISESNFKIVVDIFSQFFTKWILVVQNGEIIYLGKNI